MTDRRRASGPDGRTSDEHNPFAPPPEGTPDQPWEARRRNGGEQGDGDGDQEQNNGRRSPWKQWSSRQPGRQGGGFGQSPEPGRERENRAPRWDPNDPRQRHARYALLAGAWGLFPALLGWEWLALFLAAFALYWGIDSLRGAPSASRTEKDDEDAATKATRDAWQAAATGRDASEETDGAGEKATGDASRRPTTTVAVMGVVMASLTLCLVLGNFAVQMTYQEYFSCSADALTIPSQEACESLLPEVLHPVYIGNE